MVTYRLVQSRRHVFELLRDDASAAEIAIHGARANVITAGARYDLDVVDGIRKRVIRIDDRTQTVARSSTLAAFAVDLDAATLYWRSLPARVYCWMAGDGSVAARYLPRDDGSWLVESDLALDVLTLGAYLIVRATAPAREIPLHGSLAFEQRSR